METLLGIWQDLSAQAAVIGLALEQYVPHIVDMESRQADRRAVLAATFASALGFYLLLLLFVRPIVGLFRFYQSLPDDRKRWCESTCISQVHCPISGVVALLCTAAGPICTVGDPMAVGSDAFYTVTNLQALVLCFTCGYMIQDGLFCLYHRLDTIFVFHHALIIVSYLSGLLATPCFGAYYMVMLQTMELTAFWANLSYFLEMVNLKSSIFFTLNGVVWIVTFFLNRVVWGTWVMMQMIASLDERITTNPLSLFSWGTGVVFLALQYFFMFLLVQGVVKELSGSAKSNAKEQQKKDQ